jgi:hypothetical protein
MSRLLLQGVLLVLALAVAYRVYEHYCIVLRPVPSLRLQCARVLEGKAYGPEDFALSKLHEVLFVSSHNRRVVSSTGTILAIDTVTGLEKDITIQSVPKNFRPHGLAIFEDAQRCTLFVVSHRAELLLPHAVEVFDYHSASATLVHSRTLSSTLLTSPNDLYAINFDELLVSNDHCTGSPLAQLMHDAVGHECADTVYFSGNTNSWTSLNDPVSFGNGLIVHRGSSGGDHLIRSAAASYKLYNYSFQKEAEESDCEAVGSCKADASSAGAPTLKLNYVETLPLSPDNIEYDEYSGGLLIAGHPSTARFLINALFEVPAPSGVIIYYGQNNYEVLYYSDGNELSASSVAVRTNETTYFLGQVFDPFVLRCTRASGVQ